MTLKPILWESRAKYLLEAYEALNVSRVYASSRLFSPAVSVPQPNPIRIDAIRELLEEVSQYHYDDNFLPFARMSTHNEWICK